MLSHSVDEASGVVEIVIDGPVERADYDAAITAIDAMIERHGTVKVLEILKSFGWVDPSIWWKDTVWGLTHLRDFGRCAVVSDSGWVGPFARAIGALIPAEVRVFPLHEAAAAREWLKTGVNRSVLTRRGRPE